VIDVNNGRYAVEHEAELTVRGLLSVCRFTALEIHVFVNGALIERQSYDSQLLYDGDKVRVLHMVAGG
jgi:sulfur carrier protein